MQALCAMHEADVFCAQVIMPLINNWNDTGGVGEVLSWNGLSAHEDFFTDLGARRTYRNTVKAILTCVLALLLASVAYAADCSKPQTVLCIADVCTGCGHTRNSAAGATNRMASAFSSLGAGPLTSVTWLVVIR